jgi:glycosyltransferase involved in cell wall biosynthesis
MEQKKLRVVFYDEATAVGGSLVVLSHFFKEADRTQIEPLLISALSRESLHGLFNPDDIAWAEGAPLNYVTRMRWMAALGKGKWARRFGAYLHTAAEIIINLQFQLRLLFLFVRLKPDIIHINNGLLPFIFGLLLRIPVVFHLHAIASPSSAQGWRIWLINKSKALVAISPTVMRSVVEGGYDSSKVYLINNPAPLPKFSESKRDIRKKLDLPCDRVLILHVGRIVPWKGQMEFLKSFRIAHEQFPNALALIVGDSGEGFGNSYLGALKDYVQKNGLDEAVQFLGFSSDVLPLMYAADIVVHSSIEPEPFGLVITEAMAVETSVIASIYGASAEIVTHGVDGVVIDPINEKAFAQAQFELFNDPLLRQNLAAQALKKVQKTYDSKSFADLLIKVYHTAYATHVNEQ